MKSRTKADPGALSIAPPDGYQYGDDHPWDWDETKQQGLSDQLDKLRKGATPGSKRLAGEPTAELGAVSDVDVPPEGDAEVIDRRAE
jgi:hypothetical protein